ncbi:MAG: PQQ-binding-like beta-propeller repeat protein, partial [Planctomycetales bacterium]|nr:PQQ-binding-like beta-propeller repeat protein [Planctomycetales bacterium]
MSALELIDRLAQQQLISDKMAASLRKQVKAATKPVSAENLAKLLVKKGQLTAAQAKLLLAAPKPPPVVEVDDELGLADDMDKLVEPIDDEIVEPVEPLDVAPPPVKPKARRPEPEFAAFDEGIGHDDSQLDESELDAHDFGEVSSDAGGRAIPRRRGGLGGLLAMLRPGGPKKFRANRWDSPLMLVGGGSLIVLSLVGFALYLYLSRGTGDDAFNQANENYRQQAYGQATAQFQQFLSDYPDHPKVSLARVRIGMAEIWSQVERKDWPAALNSVRSNLPAIETQDAFSDARPELASLLPEIMDGFAEAALNSKEVPEAEANLQLANEAFDEVNNSSYLPTSTRQGQQPRIEEILGKLETVKFRINQDRELASTVVKIGEAAAQGDIAAAYDHRKKLLSAYAKLESDPRLDEAVLKVTEIERAAVRPWTDLPTPTTTDLPVASQYRVVLSQQRGKALESLNGTIAVVQTQGAVYGLDAASGKVLWRRYVGFNSLHTPVVLASGGGDPIVVDARNNELLRLDAATGNLKWRLPCPAPLTQPGEASGRILVGCKLEDHGIAFAVDPQDGHVTGGVELPVPITVSPTYDADRQRYVQPASHSTVYLFSADDWSCQGVSYLGHGPDTIAVSAAVVGDILLVAENPGVDFARLHVLGDHPEKPGVLQRRVEAARLDGQVVVPIQVAGKRVLVATNHGKVMAMELDVNQTDSPLRNVADAIVSVAPGTISYPLLDEGRIVVGDNQLTGYEL